MDLMTVIETAEYLRISKQTLYKWNSMGIVGAHDNGTKSNHGGSFVSG